jgi:uncharacterized MnhB-related membrane protein
MHMETSWKGFALFLFLLWLFLLRKMSSTDVWITECLLGTFLWFHWWIMCIIFWVKMDSC